MSRMRGARTAAVSALTLAVVLLPGVANATPTPDVKVLSSSSYTDHAGQVVVVGEVQNVGNENANVIQVYIDELDILGNVLDSNSTIVGRLILEPDDKSPFAITFSPPSGYYSYRIESVTWQATPTAPDWQVSVSELKSGTAADGFRDVSGVITNHNSARAGPAQAFVTLYGASGTVVGVHYVFANTPDGYLAAGASAPFDAEMDSDVPGYTSYSVVAVANDEPTPPPGQRPGVSELHLDDVRVNAYGCVGSPTGLRATLIHGDIVKSVWISVIKSGTAIDAGGAFQTSATRAVGYTNYCADQLGIGRRTATVTRIFYDVGHGTQWISGHGSTAQFWAKQDSIAKIQQGANSRVTGTLEYFRLRAKAYRPLADAKVVLQRTIGNGWRSVGTLTTDTRGRFNFPKDPKFTYRIHYAGATLIAACTSNSA